MSQKIVLRQAASNRRQPLLQSHSRKAGTRLGEVVGGTAAVCCCCPCGIANFMFLAIYKVPASLCRRALKKKRRRHLANNNKKEGLFPPRRGGCKCGCCDDVFGSFRVHPMCADDVADVKPRNLVEQDKEVTELEKEMWDRFYGSGFWRSPSRRDSSSSLQRITSTVSVSNLLLQPGKENL